MIEIYSDCDKMGGTKQKTHVGIQAEQSTKLKTKKSKYMLKDRVEPIAFRKKKTRLGPEPRAPQMKKKIS